MLVDMASLDCLAMFETLLATRVLANNVFDIHINMLCRCQWIHAQIQCDINQGF